MHKLSFCFCLQLDIKYAKGKNIFVDKTLYTDFFM